MGTQPYKKKPYTPSTEVTDAQRALQEHQAAKPGQYQSQYQKPIDDLTGQIKNRGPFNYDPNSDPAYKGAVEQYVQRGKAAMQDTMGQAAAMTGGYGSSYGQAAGQQAYNAYIAEAANLAPRYQQMAMERYKLDGDELMRKLGILTEQEAREYGRAQDQLGQYNREQDRLQNIYDRASDRDYERHVQDQNFEYGVLRDQQEAEHRLARETEEDRRYQEEWQHRLDQEALEKQRYQENREYQQGRDAIADQRYDAEWQHKVEQDEQYQKYRDIALEQDKEKFIWDRQRWEYEKQQADFAYLQLLAENGAEPTPEELERAGITLERFHQIFHATATEEPTWSWNEWARSHRNWSQQQALKNQQSGRPSGPVIDRGSELWMDR